MSNDTVQQIQQNIRDAKARVELYQCLVRLSENRDFRKLIKEGYLEQEAIRLVHLRGDPSFQTPERQASVLASIDAIGQLLQYFNTVTYLATMAEKSIASDEAQIEEIMQEEAQQ